MYNASPRCTTQTALHQPQHKHKLWTLTRTPSSTHSKGAQLQSLVTSHGILHPAHPTSYPYKLPYPHNLFQLQSCQKWIILRRGTTVLDWMCRVQMTSVLPMNLSHLFHLRSINSQDSTLRTAIDGCYWFEQKACAQRTSLAEHTHLLALLSLFYRERRSKVPMELQVVTHHTCDWDFLLVPYSLH